MTDYIGLKLGNYRILRLIGQGGFAKVYHAQHIYLKTPAAIKILNMSLVDDALENFLNEARTIALLEHPHIVRVLEFGIEGIIPFLVMSYAENGTLRQHASFSLNKRLPWTNIVSYAKQAAEALQYAHDNGIIHRDVKPENMLLGKNQQLLLSDFGLAIIAQNTSAATSEKAGTTMYMAPEQIQGHPCRASDQYALAVVVYEYLCGSCPFTGSEHEIAIQHLYTPPPPIRSKMPNLSPAVEQVVMKALTKNPQARFATVQEFAQALTRIENAEAVYRPIEVMSVVSPVLSVDTTHEIHYNKPKNINFSKEPVYKFPTQPHESINIPSSGTISLHLPTSNDEPLFTVVERIIQPSLELPSSISSTQFSSQQTIPVAPSTTNASPSSLPQRFPTLSPSSDKHTSTEKQSAALPLQAQPSPFTYKKSIKRKTIIIAGIVAVMMIFVGVCFNLPLNKQEKTPGVSALQSLPTTIAASTRFPTTPPPAGPHQSTPISTHATSTIVPPTQIPSASTLATPTATDAAANTPSTNNAPLAPPLDTPTPMPTPNPPLTVGITAPSTAQAGSTITVLTQASRGNVTIALDGIVRSFGQQITDSQGNATFQIFVPRFGKRMVLTATATDDQGNQAQSDPHTILIS